MKIGKVPENVLKRAVFKQIHHRRQEVLLHPGVGEDCAAVAPEQGVTPKGLSVRVRQRRTLFSLLKQDFHRQPMGDRTY